MNMIWRAWTTALLVHPIDSLLLRHWDLGLFSVPTSSAIPIFVASTDDLTHLSSIPYCAPLRAAFFSICVGYLELPSLWMQYELTNALLCGSHIHRRLESTYF
jgi:hypothetical protein